ncbi:MAG: DMT family transporter [Phycisphaerae bacterium]|nr:DMT family transporter [Phycisphaerae bacterium]
MRTRVAQERLNPGERRASASGRLGRWMPVAALVLCATMWSLNGPLIKLLMQPRDGAPGVSGLTIACYRSLIGGLVFLPFALPRLRQLRRVAIGWPLASVSCFTVMTVSFVIATTQTAAANAIILQYTSPIWVFLLSPLLLREKPRLLEGLVLIVAMAGVATIFAGSAATETRWLLLSLASGFGYGALTVTLRGLKPVNPVVVACLNALGSGLVIGMAVVIWATFWMTPAQWALMLLMGLVQFIAPYVLFSWALQRVEAHRAALIVLLETVLNPLWTYLLVGEAVPGATLVGGPLILLGVVGWVLVGWWKVPQARPGLAGAPDAPVVVQSPGAPPRFVDTDGPSGHT